MAVPEDFRCAISLEVMSDPVILSSGHTFDRSSIQSWLDSGHRTCPITQLPLPYHPLPSPPTTPSAPSSPPSPVSLLLRPPPPPPPSSNPSLGLLDSHHGGCGGREVSPAIVRKALTLILNLSLDDHNNVGLVAEGVIPRGSEGSDGQFSDCRAIAATVITSLAVVEVNKAVIGEDESVVGLLVGLVKEGGVREKREGLTALCTLCSTYEGYRRRAVREGAVAMVMAAVKEVTGLARGVELLGMLGKCREG